MAHTVRIGAFGAIIAAAALMFATAAAADAEEATAAAHHSLEIEVSCEGTQDQIDTCVGATNYAPIADHLGVPYYAQHNGMGGEQWLDLEAGDTVTAEGVTYTITEVRTVSTGGDFEQIEDMQADAYLQTCLDNNVQSRVFALHAA